ncbi:MAG: undecaprenyl-diphosphate phosphatase, partial [Halobacteriovoraceae bacterium]|nr:undecaprenyl-diphosphate phosphatase [Halobacteriovoraceae bacterium]
FGVLMFIADYRGSKGVTNTMYQKFQWKKSFLIGFFQALAIFPGVSRSGSTLTISRFIGMSREEATRFSFLLSLPVIFGGMIFKGRELFENPSVDWSAISIGLTVSFLTGLLTIHYFLKFIKKMGLGLFSIYRILFALFLLSYF